MMMNYQKLLFNEDSWMNDIFCLPPELLNENGNIDYNAVNIWKAGCIIYELCTLNPPFNGKSNKEIINKISEGIYKKINNQYSNDFAC